MRGARGWECRGEGGGAGGKCTQTGDLTNYSDHFLRKYRINLNCGVKHTPQVMLNGNKYSHYMISLEEMALLFYARVTLA